ncbi:MAG: twin-arginine translocation signal domain-containing protein [Gemmatimonadota bacterium]
MKDTTDLHHGTDRRAFLRRLGLGAVAGGLAGAGGLLVPEGARAPGRWTAARCRRGALSESPRG